MEDSTEFLATVVVAYSLSTLLTGLVFLLLGYLKLGNLLQFFPRHILVSLQINDQIGTIGGIGVFLIITGLQVTTGLIADLSNATRFFAGNELFLWSVPFMLAILLKLLQTQFKHQLFIPCFYAVLPLFFYILVFTIGIDLESLRSQGWLFTLSTGQSTQFYTYWTYFDFTKVSFKALIGISKLTTSLHSSDLGTNIFWLAARTNSLIYVPNVRTCLPSSTRLAKNRT